MLNKHKNSVIIISVIMIIIHSIGLIYMMFQKISFLTLFMKILYIFLFIFYLIFVFKKPSKSHIMAIILSVIIFIHSSINYDFLDSIIAIIFCIYALDLSKTLDTTNKKDI